MLDRRSLLGGVAAGAGSIAMLASLNSGARAAGSPVKVG